MSDFAPTDQRPLPAGDFTEADEPLALFAAWFEEARKSEPSDPEAMALATVDADGLPNVRMVLLKGFDPRGFAFYSNEESQKGRELAGQAKAGLAFHWKSLRRQVRLRGTVEPVGEAEADAYFASRPRSSQIGAWASKQSRPLESRLAFEKAIAMQTARFAVSTVPRPAVLGRLPHRAGGDGILARPSLPAARPDRIPPHRPRRPVDEAAPLSLMPVSRFSRPGAAARIQADMETPI